MVPHLHEPLGERAEDLELVDRLPGAGVAQLGRPVGGQHDERHAGLMRLDHAGQQVGQRAPGRARDRDRRARGLGQAQGEEAGRALVDHRVRLDAPVAGQGKRDRRVARPGRRDGVPHPAAGELVDHRLDRCVGAVEWDHSPRVEPPTVTFVPGFMQRGEAWEPVAARLGADGASYRSTRVDFTTWTFEERIEELLDAAPPGAAVVGYSMGGRLALHAALREPARFGALVLVGVTAGIEDRGEREERRRSDESLAEWMERRSIEEVVARWEANPVFATQPAALKASQRAGRLSHDPRRLAELLRSAGQGATPPVWDRLDALRTPVLLTAGERDRRYATAARRMAGRLPHARVRLVRDAGHAPQLEAPDVFTALLREFLDGVLGSREDGAA